MLNIPQQEAVEHVSSPLLVLAGAGSGKTRVICHKIAHLRQKLGLYKIISISFTNKAATEMQQRVGEMLPSDPGLQISTFHILGYKILLSSPAYQNISIFDRGDSVNLLKELSKDKGAEQYLNQISSWKNDLIGPEQAMNEAQTEHEGMIAGLYTQYNECLRAYKACDFDDLLYLPVELLRQEEELRQKWQCEYLLVDEYQDTNLSQYELIKLLNKQQFTVVGDDDQAIYSWRGAKVGNIASLADDFPNLKVIKLEQNYRSSSHILESANQLISHNPHLYEKKLWSDYNNQGQIRVLKFRNEFDEAKRIISEIYSKGNYGSCAILYRSNHQAIALEQVCRELSIPYQVSGGLSLFARSEVKDIIAYLRILVKPEDDLAFLRIANRPNRGLGPSTLTKLSQYAKKRGTSMYLASFELGLSQELGAKAIGNLQSLTHYLCLQADNLKRLDPVEVIRGLGDNIGLYTWLHEHANSPKVGQKKEANVRQVLGWIAKMVGDGDSLSSVVNKLMIMDTQKERKDNLQLMTMHAAKGLEFDQVYIVGMLNGILPHRNSLEQDGLEEERRLLYVGMTRARHNLTLSYGHQDFEPSQFIEELITSSVKMPGQKGQSTAMSANYLGDIKAMLAKEL